MTHSLHLIDPENPLLACIDIGSNGIHLAICRYEGQNKRALTKIATMSEKVQLGAGLDKSGRLTKEAQDKGLDCLRRFSDRLAHINPSCARVVATNALRQAVNSDDFIRLANEILPSPIEIISGREEARLIYFGVANSEPSHKKRLVIDIGGGSTELIIGRHKTPILTESAQMGTVSFAKRFFGDGKITNEAFDTAIQTAKKEIIAHEHLYKKTGFDAVVGTSGTIKAIQKSLNELKLGKDISLKSARILKKTLIGFGQVENIHLSAIKSHRKAIFPAGLAILIAVMEIFAIKKMRYCDSALKEGVIFDMLGRFTDDDIRTKSLETFLGQFMLDKKHTKRMLRTVRLLFMSGRMTLGLDDNDKKLLDWASWLHEIGLVIGHSGYHRHSAYMVEHAEIAGFSKSDQQKLSTLIRHHRRKIGVREYKTVAKISEKLVHLVLLFRLASLLNHSRKDGIEEMVKFSTTTTKDWHITLFRQGEHQTLLTALMDDVPIFKAWGIHLTIEASENSRY